MQSQLEQKESLIKWDLFQLEKQDILNKKKNAELKIITSVYTRVELFPEIFDELMFPSNYSFTIIFCMIIWVLLK